MSFWTPKLSPHTSIGMLLFAVPNPNPILNPGTVDTCRAYLAPAASWFPDWLKQK